jgi:hypothetical protein
VSGKSNPTYRLSEVGLALGIGYRHARRLVQQGELLARNIAPAGEKPRWVVSRQALAAIKKRRAK